eukprot:15438283-Alexandrium_andersonii.AAC.1
MVTFSREGLRGVLRRSPCRSSSRRPRQVRCLTHRCPVGASSRRLPPPPCHWGRRFPVGRPLLATL